MIPKTSPIPTATSPYSAPRATASISCCSSVTSRPFRTRPPGSGRRSREVGGRQPLGVEGFPRADRQAQLRIGHHVRPVGEPRRQLRPLLDEQDRDAAVADLAERAEDRLDDRGSETERRLVEEQQLRIREQCPSDRELLLLAPRQRACGTRAELLDDREELVHPGERFL